MTEHGYADVYAAAIASLGEDFMRRQFTAEMIAGLERQFSGGKIERGIKWPNVSPDDPREAAEIARGGHDGHRMQPREVRGRNYAADYARELSTIDDERMVLVELGILRGIGLAVWCDLFPNARIIGLDVDLSHFEEHREQLVRYGAFSKNTPEVYEYDELAEGNAARLASILGAARITIAIDDALHIREPIIKAMTDLLPFMAPKFLYFVEDHRSVYKNIHRAFPHLEVRPFGELTVVNP